MGSLKQVFNQVPVENIQKQVFEAFKDRPLTSTAAAIGAAWTAYQLHNFSSTLYFYFLRRSLLNRYQTKGTESSWALITGSSDGIGKGFAEELCSRGFNVVIHGRNEAKLKGVRDELLKQWPQRKVRIIVLDATSYVHDIEKMDAIADQVKDINLRILVNNIAGGVKRPMWVSLADRKNTDIAPMIDATARFPTEITRVLLPLLIKNGPSLILNIGSGASEGAMPYLGFYAGCKAYNKVWSAGLGAEMRAEGHHNIEVLHILVGMVQSRSEPRPTSLTVPSSRRMAKAGLDVVGCGYSAVWAYWPHAMMFAPMLAMPEWLADRMIQGIAREEKAMEAERVKQGAYGKQYM